MTLKSEAQLVVEDYSNAHDGHDGHGRGHGHDDDIIEISPEHSLDGDVVIYETKPTAHDLEEVYSLEPGKEHHSAALPNIPGAGPDGQDDLVVEDHQIEIEPEHSKADDEGKKKQGIWDWAETHGLPGFVEWVKTRLANIPKHSGRDVAGCERAIAFIERVRDEMRRAMKQDLESVLDAQAIEHLYEEIDEGIGRLHERTDKLSEKFKGKKKKKKSEAEEVDGNLVKEGQKATHVGGIIVTVPLLIHRLARVCINGTVSAGHDIEELFGKSVKKYALDTREQAELMQLLSDMGYPLRRDRGFDLNEDMDPTKDGADFAANYQA